MVSTVKVDVVAPRVATGTTTLGISGDKLLIPSGVTLTNSGTASGFDSGLNRQVVYTASTSAGGYSPEADVTKLIVIVQGGGGGGNRHDSLGSNRHGGGGGGYVMKYISSVSSTDTMTVTVGAAGAGATSNNGGGGSGTVSSFASVSGTSFTILSAGGGVGGPVTANLGATGGTATGGDVNIVGCSTCAYNGQTGHSGGESLLGHGGDGVTSIYTSTTNATGYGAGGGWSDDVTAGNGSAGVVIIQEYK